MKLTKIISSLAIAAVVALGTLGAPNLRAQDPAAPAAPAAAEPKKEEAKKVAATLEQRLAIVEAYIGNGDPSVPLKTLKTKDAAGVEGTDYPPDFDKDSVWARV